MPRCNGGDRVSSSFGEEHGPDRKVAHFPIVVHRETIWRTFKRGKGNGTIQTIVCSLGSPLQVLGRYSMVSVREAGSEAPKKDREGSPGTEVRKGASLAERPHPLAFRQSVGGQARHYEQGGQNSRGGPCSLDHPQAEAECPEEADTTQELPSPAASPDLHSQKKTASSDPSESRRCSIVRCRLCIS